MVKMKIIPAAAEHLDSVYQLICELENECMDKDIFFQVYQNNITDDSIYYLLAEEGLNIVGFASLHIQSLLHHCAKIGEIQEIVIAKEARHLGIGSKMFNRIKEIAADNNCVQIEVCCNQTRVESHKFYCKQGMKNSHYKFALPLNNP